MKFVKFLVFVPTAIVWVVGIAAGFAWTVTRDGAEYGSELFDKFVDWMDAN